MHDRQLAIPGLETSPSSPECRVKPSHIEKRVAYLEGKVKNLELEFTIIKIQMEKEYA